MTVSIVSTQPALQKEHLVSQISLLLAQNWGCIFQFLPCSIVTLLHAEEQVGFLQLTLPYQIKKDSIASRF